MLELYAIPVSLYCAKTRILLRYKGLEWTETPPPGGYGSDEYKTVVPSGNLPALRDGELLLSDSEAIAEYLNDKYPEPPALPDAIEARAKVRERSRFHDTRLEPALRTVFPYLPGRGAAPDGFIEAQSARVSALLRQLGHMFEDTPDAGKTMTLAECGYPITFAWIDALAPPMSLQMEWPDAVLSYRRCLESLPAIADELSRYLPKLDAFVKS